MSGCVLIDYDNGEERQPVSVKVGELLVSVATRCNGAAQAIVEADRALADGDLSLHRDSLLLAIQEHGQVVEGLRILWAAINCENRNLH